ncbi:MAG: GNAT family N-acetyltransferase [Thermoanaerobaculia bacterium]
MLIERMHAAGDAAACAAIMAGSDPWRTLGRTFDDCLQMVADQGKEVYLARSDGQVAGFIIVDMRGVLRGYIQIVAVHAEHRSEGVGRHLISFAEERIHRESPNVFLCVSSFNPGARRLYERLGFLAVGELTDFLVRGHSEILMRKTRGPWAEFARVEE